MRGREHARRCPSVHGAGGSIELHRAIVTRGAGPVDATARAGHRRERARDHILGRWTSSRPTSGACAAPGCRCSSRTTRPTRTSSRARCRCCRSSSPASCSAPSTATGRGGPTRWRCSARWRSSSAAWRWSTTGAAGRALSIPDRVGPIELAAFVLVPALLPLVFGGQVTSALVTAGGNLLLLALIYLVVGIGLLSILRWAGGAARQPARGVAEAAHARGPGAADLHDRPVRQHGDVAGLLRRLGPGARRRRRAVSRRRLGVRRLAAAARGARARAGRRRRPAAHAAPALQRRPRDVRQPGPAGARRRGARRRVLRRVRRAGDHARRRRDLDRRAAARDRRPRRR